MKGVEFRTLFGLVILVAVVVLVVILIINPSLAFGKSNQARINFEEFCTFWSLSGYNDNIVTIGSEEKVASEECATFLNLIGAPNVNDIEVCKKCCRKEIAC